MYKFFERTIILILIISTLLGTVLPTTLYADEDVPTQAECIAFRMSSSGDGGGIVVFTAPLYEYKNVDSGKYEMQAMSTMYDENATEEEGGIPIPAAIREVLGENTEIYCYDWESINFKNSGETPTYVYMKIDDWAVASTSYKVFYRKYNPERVEYDENGTDKIKISMQISGETAEEQVAEATKGGTTFFEKIEKIFASIVTGTANAIVRLINLAVGGENGVTPDDIIFNHYEPTKLLYFDSYATNQGNKGTSDNQSGEKSLAFAMVGTIRKWTNVFTEIATVGYLTVLLYVGIQILWNSTARKKAEYQRMLVDWVVGVGLLFMFPLLVNYSIQINDALVAEIEASKSEAAADDTSNAQVSVGTTSIAADATEAEQDSFANSWSASPYAEGDTNYMAKMQQKAQSSRRLSYAIVYMIMVWQLLMLLVTYYRRLFMVGFLLVLFPLVALTYALDKIKDGKSQAFDRWAKEILLNIFLQTFHAIIYVFAINASFAGGEQNDWLLMIIGISFLFKGEQIIKALFGQKSDTAPSLANSALKTAAVFAAVKTGGKKLKDNFIGSDSHIGKAIAANRNARMYENMVESFDKIASTGPEFEMPAASALPHAPTTMDRESEQLGNDIQMINNRDMVGSAALAMAIDRVQHYNGKYNAMLSDLNVDMGKLGAMQTIKEGAIKQLKAGTEKVKVEQNIRLELETLFHGEDIDRMQQALYRQMAAPLNSNHIKRNINEGFVRKELDDARQRRKDINDSYKFASQDGKLDADMQKEVDDLLFDTYGTSNNTEDQKKMARAIVIVKNRDKRKFSVKDQAAAMKYITDHKNQDEAYQHMISTLGVNLDEMNLALAHNVMQRAQKGNGVKENVRQWAEQTIAHYDNDDNPLKDESQEISIYSLYKDEPLSVIGQDSSDKIVKRIIEDRIAKNREEADMLRNFAQGLIKDDEKIKIPTINGMTREELIEMAEDERAEATKQVVRGVAETAGAIAGAPIGAAAGIAFAESNKGPIAEGLAGGFAGAVIGDQIAGGIVGGTREKEYMMTNPYTGKDEKVKLRVGGAFSERLYSYEDTSLPENVRGKIREQFIATAAARRRKEEEEKQKRIDEANRRNGRE